MQGYGEKWAFLTDLVPKGADNAISGATLEKMLNCETRMRYALIESARLDGVIICANQQGYYQPETVAEMKDYYTFSKSKAIAILKCLKPLRKKLIDAGETVR